MSDYQLIALDLDGTLTNRDKIITPRTKKALMELQESGKKIVLASGRPTVGMTKLAKELELARYGSYLLSFNGGMIVDCRTGEVIFSRLLPVESYEKIFALARKEQVDVFTYEGRTLITDNAKNPYAVLEKDIDGMELKQVEDLTSYVTFGVPKIVLTEDGDFLAMVEPRVKAAMGRDFNVYRSEPYYLEVLPKGIDKGRSLIRLLDLMGLKKEQMIACGDGYNDLTMIQAAGLGVAMENAVLPVRKAAGYITYSNNEDGVAHVVEKFMLESDESY